MKKNGSRWGILRRLGHYRAFIQDGKDAGERSGDAAENERGRLPQDEGIQVPAISMVELYTPSQIGRLTEGLRKLGWERGWSRNESLVQWAENARRDGTQGWVSLGFVTDARTPRPMSERYAHFPLGIESAHPVLIALTPSITALVVNFYFSVEESKSLEYALTRTYTTYTVTNPLLRIRDVVAYIVVGKRAKFSRTVHNPDSQRRDSVRSALNRLERKCEDWFRGNLPGIFASGLCDGKLPAAALLVTEKIAPTSDEMMPLRAFDGLAISRGGERWTSPHWPGAALCMSHDSEYSDSRLTFICRRRDAFPVSPIYREPTSNGTIGQRAEETIRGILTKWALSRALSGYRAELSSLRDKTASANKHRPIEDLRALRGLVKHRLYDAIITAQEVEEFAQERLGYSYDTVDWQMVGPNGTTYSLVEHFAASQTAESRRIVRDANSLQSVLSAISNISQTISNLRIQYLIILLTVVSTLIAAWALYISIKTAH